MYKKLIIVIILLSLKNNLLFSQKDTSQYFNKTLSNNNFSIELGGKGGLYSIGYERTLYRSQSFLLSGSINVGGIGGTFPIGLNTMFGKKINKLFLGLYATNDFNFNPYPKSNKDRLALRAAGQNYSQLYSLYLIPAIGYRRYFKKGNSLTIAFTPIMFIRNESTYHFNSLINWLQLTTPWFGVNYNFKF